jgi:uncharacterized LabA/DUF88 family protein
MSGKNSADIRLVVDAIDLAYSKDHIDTFVIVSGDSDFSPLVSKLKELGKHVIGLGLVDATSDLLRDNCDEFIYYEDLDRAPIIPTAVNESIPDKKRKAFALLLDSLLALRRENKEVIYSSMVKDTMKRKKPSFNEEYHGYRTFSELLEDAQKEGLVELEKHKSSGMYIVSRFGLEMKGGPAPSPGANGSGSQPRQQRPAQQPAPSGERRDGGRQPEPSRGRGGRPASPPPSPPLPKQAAPARPAVPAEDEIVPNDDRRPLGRELVEDIDELDDLELPSYGGSGRRSQPAAQAKPAPAQQPARKPAATAAAKAPAKPAEGGEPKRGRGTAGGSRGGSRRKPAESKPAEKAEAPAPRPVARPAPKPVEDDDSFGAGLD